MTERRQALGRLGEDIACRYLQAEGWLIVARNKRIGGVEVDLLGKDGDTTVFVEVKTLGDGVSVKHPAESVGRLKQKRLARAALGFFAALGREVLIRFDVIAVRPGQSQEIEHFRGAFHV